MRTIYQGAFASGHFFDDDVRPLPRRIVAAAVGEDALVGMTVERALELAEKAVDVAAMLYTGPVEPIPAYKIFSELAWNETMKAHA